MNQRNTIDLFLNRNETLAIAGVSHNPQKFGHIVYTTLKDKGFSIIPINPVVAGNDSIPFIKAVSDLEVSVWKLLIVTNKNETFKVVEEAIAKGIKNIWIQNGCETPEAEDLALNNNINLVSKACILMYANPTGFHKFHKVMANLFGGYIK